VLSLVDSAVTGDASGVSADEKIATVNTGARLSAAMGIVAEA